MNKRPPPAWFRLPTLEEEEVPDRPPTPNLQFGSSADSEEQFRLMSTGGSRFVGTMTYELLDSAWRLVELSWSRQGKYQEGMELPSSARAASAGAIAVACAAFEAVLNEALFQAQAGHTSVAHQAHNRLLGALLKLTPRERLDALAALAGELIDWGSEPFQSIDLLLSLRKSLLHHEPYFYAAGEAYWPAKALRDLPRRIGSPYPAGPTEYRTPLEWYVHILTPAGAEWAVRTVYDTFDIVEDLWRVVRALLDDPGGNASGEVNISKDR
jgi:hypothetical protein